MGTSRSRANINTGLSEPVPVGGVVTKIDTATELADAESGQQVQVSRTTQLLPEMLEPPRRCKRCGARLTVQVLPHGYESHCTPCERRARAHAATAHASRA